MANGTILFITFLAPHVAAESEGLSSAAFENATKQHKLDMPLFFLLRKISSGFAFWVYLHFLFIFDPAVFMWLKLKAVKKTPAVCFTEELAVLTDCSTQEWLILELRRDYLGSCHYNTKKKSNWQYLYRQSCFRNCSLHRKKYWETHTGTKQNTKLSPCLSLLLLVFIFEPAQLSQDISHKDMVKSKSPAG